MAMVSADDAAKGSAGLKRKLRSDARLNAMLFGPSSVALTTARRTPAFHALSAAVKAASAKDANSETSNPRSWLAMVQ